MWKIKNIFKKEIKRERLQLLHYIKTDNAEYFVYNTQTVKRDPVNIEIERVKNDLKRIILEEEIYEDSLGGLCGNSFSHLVHDSLYHLREYIKENNEFIIEDKII